MNYVGKIDARDEKPQMRERRLRQPNWTEAEKELLISLTTNYRIILENKSSDSAALKKKAHVWDLIAMQMRDAGYNRSKERLKQQLGRIRAANAKQARDSITGNPKSHSRTQSIYGQCGPDTSSGYCSFNNSGYNRNRTFHNNNNKSANMTNHFKRCDYSTNSMYNSMPTKAELSVSDYDIKIEQTKSYEMCDEITESKPIMQSTIMLTDDDDNVEDDVDDEPNTTQKPSTSTTMVLNKRLTNGRRQQQLQRQFHMYRIAVERERLKSIRMQQQRDRQLHRKDLQIQNLKLQILRNLIQQNHSNPINF